MIGSPLLNNSNLKRLIPKKLTGWGKLEYSNFKELMRKENPELYNRLLMEYARSLSPSSEIIRWVDAKGNPRVTPAVVGMSGTDPVGLFFVEGVASAPVFKLLGKAGKWLLRKSGLKKAILDNFNLDFTNGRPYVTPEEFYSLDVVPRSTLKYNNPIKSPLTDFSYEKTKMAKGVAGDFNPTTGKVRISETLTPMREAATKVHEFRHRLDGTYKRIIPQDKLLGSYKVYRGAAHKASSELEEKMATNTEFRYLLFNEYTKKFGRKPTISELNKYIDNMSIEELSSRLSSVNGYGLDYVGTFSKWIDGEENF